MDIRSELYRMFMQDFQTDGVAVHQFIIVYGPIRTPTNIIQARDDAWGRMTMDALRLPYTVKVHMIDYIDAQQLEDDDSDQSEGSVVRSFAEVVQPSPGRKSPMPRRKQR